MQGKKSRVLRYIDIVNEWSGKIFSYTCLFMVFAISYEVVARYGFHRPTTWAHELTQYAFILLILMGGGYTYLKGGHVSMDAIYLHLSPRVRTILDLVTSMLAFLFLVVFIWKGVEMGMYSVAKLEKSLVMEFPIYIIRCFIPLGGILFLIQVLAKFITNITSDVVWGKGSHSSPQGGSSQ